MILIRKETTNIAKADKPIAKRDFAFKAGNSGCGGILTMLIGICAFFIIKWIAPWLIAGCVALVLVNNK